MVETLTKESFKIKIFDYETNQLWKYNGTKPALIDFYAKWCGPCKMLAPILEDLSEEYKGRIDIYKINTEEEQELSAVFGIKSIPSLLFIPIEGIPTMTQGAMSKESLKITFKDIFNLI